MRSALLPTKRRLASSFKAEGIPAARVAPPPVQGPPKGPRPSRGPLFWLSLLPLLFLILNTGCAAKYAYDEAPGMSSADAYGGEYAKESMAMPPAPAPSRGMMASGAPAQPREASQAAAPQATPAPIARMIHYAGSLSLEVINTERALSDAAKMTTEAGGFVERLDAQSVTLRVPAEHFKETIDALAQLGEVLDRRISAQDVTDAFQDAELQRRTKTATRDRLIALLAMTTDEKEKMRLLREIQRLSDEIEALQEAARTLEDLARFSRIVLRVQPRLAPGDRERAPDLNAFAWVRALYPTDASPPRGKRVELEVPEGLVLLNKRGDFICAGADGARIWAVEIDNEPLGDTDFWAAAIQERLAEGFDEVEGQEHGGYAFLRMADHGDDPYAWWIGVKAEGKDLEVVHIFFPSLESEARHIEAVLGAISGEQEDNS